MIRKPARRAVAVVLAAACAACSPDDPAADAGAGAPVAPDSTLAVFDSSEVRIATAGDTIPLEVELAVTEEQRALGLMERPSLAPDRGMLFLFARPQPPQAGFWMFRTRIPLDIAYLDGSGTIVAMASMEPCTSPYPRWCQTYPAGVPYSAALEVNRGLFAARRVELGDRVLIPPAVAARGR